MSPGAVCGGDVHGRAGDGESGWLQGVSRRQLLLPRHKHPHRVSEGVLLCGGVDQAGALPHLAFRSLHRYVDDSRVARRFLLKSIGEFGARLRFPFSGVIAITCSSSRTTYWGRFGLQRLLGWSTDHTYNYSVPKGLKMNAGKFSHF